MEQESYSPDDLIVTSIASMIEDGEVVVQGLATPLVACAYLLARKTHAPNLYFASAIGQSLCREPAPLGLTRVESLWLDRSLAKASFAAVASEILTTLKPKEFFRPAQIDPFGNFNNIAFGNSYQKPRLRLPGTGGIPDVTTYFKEIYLYAPRHSRVTFVDKLDFRSGLGYHPDRRYEGGPKFLVSDMGIFDFHNHRMRLTGYFPGCTPAKIQAHTGFFLDIAPDVVDIAPPDSNILNILNHEVDPLGIRKLERLSGSARRTLLFHILKAEASYSE